MAVLEGGWAPPGGVCTGREAIGKGLEATRGASCTPGRRTSRSYCLNPCWFEKPGNRRFVPVLVFDGALFLTQIEETTQAPRVKIGEYEQPDG
jgi:hypothetical protein